MRHIHLKTPAPDMVIRIVTSTVIGLILAVMVVIPLNAHRKYAGILRNPTAIINQKDKGITLLDRYNRPFFHFYEARSKKIIPLSQVPTHMQQAIIAIEDQTFYQHHGISPRGIVRAGWANLQQGKILYGGSTLTQQIVKNTLLHSKKSWLRKYQEAYLALELEIRYHKPAIMAMYMNTAYFGEGAFGVEEAAQTYFNKGASELTLAEESLLAGLLTEPSLLSPLSHEAKPAITRQRIVLQKMVGMNFITAAEKEEAGSQSLAFNQEPVMRNEEAPHFALYVRDLLNDSFGENYIARSGLKVKTSIDLEVQHQAEGILDQQLEKLKFRGASNGAVIVIDPATHEILAMVGSRNWFAEEFGKFNMAIAPRQTGSAFKPIVYAAGLEEQAITPATILLDVPTTFGKDYKPVDYDGKSRGPVTVRRALANSLNVPAVAVMQKVGVRTVATLAQNVGITTLSESQDYNLALALGAGEISLIQLTNGYATLAAEGKYVPAQAILAITDKQDQLVTIATNQPKQAISPEVSFLISHILSDNRARSEMFGRTLTISRPAAVKTGTSQNYRDAWTVGYTPQLTVGVWIGNNDNKPMQSLAGALGAAPVWKNLMETLLDGQPHVAFAQPSTIAQSSLCATKQKEGAPEVIRYREYFITGTEPRWRCPKVAASPAPLSQPEIAEKKSIIPTPARQ